VRGRVVEIFSISKDKSAIPTLLDALTGEYFTVRSRAALALGNIGDASVIPFLLPLLKIRKAKSATPRVLQLPNSVTLPPLMKSQLFCLTTP